MNWSYGHGDTCMEILSSFVSADSLRNSVSCGLSVACMSLLHHRGHCIAERQLKSCICQNGACFKCDSLIDQ
jgi:hypothetical protein